MTLWEREEILTTERDMGSFLQSGKEGVDCLG